MNKMSKAVGMLAAGTGINLTIGVLYAWSVFKKAMVASWGWTHSEANAAYTVAIVVWALPCWWPGLSRTG
jgi:MFS transporter, OFA family, oxalate/formate antiporter